MVYLCTYNQAYFLDGVKSVDSNFHIAIIMYAMHTV